MASAPNSTMITSAPLTAEARENLLIKLFHEELVHQGELFVPGNSFYIHGSAHIRAHHMTNMLCAWLGIKPGYIGLEFESQPDKNTGGDRHTIFIESHVVHNEMLLGAILAHALTRYLLEERKQIHLADTYEQLSLIATGTIVFGLGIVVSNGLLPGHNHATEHAELLGTVPEHEYAAMLHGFLWQRGIAKQAYTNSLAPWSSKLLNIPIGQRPIHAVRQQIHAEKQKKYQVIGIWWLILVGSVIGGFVAAQGMGFDSKQARDLSEKARLYEHLVVSCQKSVAYSKHYSDLSDIQTQRAVNAQAARCQSLENELNTVQQAYQAAL